MNLDLLKKLTRLANNNPNENEANLAARKVCKMLAECDWKLTEDVKSPREPQYKDSPITYEAVMEMIRNMNQQQYNYASQNNQYDQQDQARAREQREKYWRERARQDREARENAEQEKRDNYYTGYRPGKKNPFWDW
jgi:hypothetical protein